MFQSPTRVMLPYQKNNMLETLCEHFLCQEGSFITP
jgi:hypothetical protein